MKLVLAAGCPYTGWEMVVSTLAAAGLGRPVDTVVEWQDQVLAESGVQDPLQLRQPLQPDSSMQERLAFLLVDDQADSRHLVVGKCPWLLDFWASRYPDTQFLLFFTGAETALTEALMRGIDPIRFIEDWKANLQHLMRFQRRYRQSALLLSAEAANLYPDALVEATRRIGLSLQSPAESVTREAPVLPEMERFLAHRLVADDPSIRALQTELEARAQPLGDWLCQASEVPLENLIKYYLQTRQDREQLRLHLHHVQDELEYAVLERQEVEQTHQATAAELQQLQARILQAEQAGKDLETTNRSLETGRKEALARSELLAEQLQRVQGELKGAVLQRQALEQTEKATSAELQQLKDRIVEAEQARRKLEITNQSLEAANTESLEENELLLKQLHAVQEELEKVFLAKQEVEQTHQAAAAELKQLQTRILQAEQAGKELETTNRSLETGRKEALARSELLAEQLQRMQEELKGAVLQRQALEQTEKAASAELQQQKARIVEAEQVRKKLEITNQSLEAANTESLEENELLLKQLHAVQEELEEVFLAKQEVEKDHQATAAKLKQLQARILQAEQAGKELEATNRSLETGREEALARSELLAEQLQRVQVEVKGAVLRRQALEQTEKTNGVELQQQKARIVEAEQARKKLEITNQSLEAANTESLEENELLLQQLHAVQEELEKVFLAKQEVEQTHQAAAAELQQLQTRILQAEQAGKELDATNRSLETGRKEALARTELLAEQLQRVQEDLKGAVLQRQALEQTEKANGVELQQLKARIVETEQARKKLEITNQSLEAANTESLEESELLLKQLHAVQEELEHYFLKYQETLTRQDVVTKEQVPVLESTPESRPLVQRKGSSGWTNHTLIRALVKPFKRPDKKREKIRRQVEVLDQSGLFDQKWYLSEYPDVASGGIAPTEHYLRFGAAEGRNPSPVFDTKYYLQSNPDVAAAGVNPLLHYIEFGISEGRQACG